MIVMLGVLKETSSWLENTLGIGMWLRLLSFLFSTGIPYRCGFESVAPVLMAFPANSLRGEAENGPSAWLT